MCAHRYVAVSEPGFGAAIVADGPRGYDVRNDAVALTILRSPRFPDPLADRGRQDISWSVTGLAGDPAYEDFELRAERILNPPRVVNGRPAAIDAPLHWDSPGSGILVSAVKPADDGSGDVIIRMWQTNGSRSVAAFGAGRFGSAVYCNALEEPTGEPLETDGRGISTARLDPFEIVTVRLSGRADS